MPTWLLIVLGIVAFLTVCAVVESRFGLDLASVTGTVAASIFVGAVVLSAAYGLAVLIIGHDPLGLGFDKASPPKPCQELPPTAPGAC